MGFGCHPSVLAEASHLAHAITERILQVAGRQCLQGKYLASCLRPDGDAIRDRVTEQFAHGVFIYAILSQVAVLGIPHQQPLPLQVTANPARYGMRQLCECFTGWRPDPAEPGCPIGTVDVRAIEEQQRIPASDSELYTVVVLFRKMAESLNA